MSAVAVAVSGGIDSLCAALLLKKAGCDIFAIHALLAPQSRVSEKLVDACARLGIGLEIIDLRQAFSQLVINPCRAAVARGMTPNPCGLCNRAIKFGALLDAAKELGADRIATGHYVNLIRQPDGNVMPGAAADKNKDQAYFLSLVARKRLAEAIFPLAGLSKARTRQIVAEAGLAHDCEPESQDICFGLEQACDLPGPILLAAGDNANPDCMGREQIGSHRGLSRYTIGQRKGLGIPWSEPLFVCAKDHERNALIVGTKNAASMSACDVSDPNFFLPLEIWPQKLYAKLRYRQRPCSCKVTMADAKMRITLLEPRQLTAPGQIAAIYDGEGRLLAGGIIDAVKPVKIGHQINEGGCQLPEDNREAKCQQLLKG